MMINFELKTFFITIFFLMIVSCKEKSICEISSKSKNSLNYSLEEAACWVTLELNLEKIDVSQIKRAINFEQELIYQSMLIENIDLKINQQPKALKIEK